MNIREVFWRNVDYFIQAQDISYYAVQTKTKLANFSKQAGERANTTLDSVQKIADALGIDDYSILFEVWEEE